MGNSISHTRNPLPPTCPCLEVLDRVTSSRRALSLPFPLSSCKAIHLPVPQHIPLPCEASQSLSACPWESPFPSLPPCTACNVSNYLGKHCTVRQNSPFHGFSVTVNRIRIRPTLPPSLLLVFVISSHPQHIFQSHDSPARTHLCNVSLPSSKEPFLLRFGRHEQDL